MSWFLIAILWCCLGNFNTTANHLSLGQTASILGWKKLKVVFSNRNRSRNVIQDFQRSEISSLIRFGLSLDLCSEQPPLAIFVDELLTAEVIENCLATKPSKTLMILSRNNHVNIGQTLNKTTSFFQSIQDDLGFVKDLQLVFTDAGGQALVRNNVLFDGNRVKIHYNLHGRVLKSIGLTWRPWIAFKSCQSNVITLHLLKAIMSMIIFQNSKCKTRGLIKDVLNIIGDWYNFTVQYDLEPNGKWGTLPVTGLWTDDNATFEGVLGEVINGHYDISASSWNPNHFRAKWLDFHTRLIYFNYLIISLSYSTCVAVF